MAASYQLDEWYSGLRQTAGKAIGLHRLRHADVTRCPGRADNGAGS
jgi:hypothetical protein